MGLMGKLIQWEVKETKKNKRGMEKQQVVSKRRGY